MKSQKHLVYLTVGIIVILAIVVSLLPKSDDSATAPEQKGSDTTAPALPKPSVLQPTAATDNKEGKAPADSTIAAQPANELEREQRIVRLREMLDHEEDHKDALKLAIELSKGTEEERTAALDVFRWVGGPESVKALIPMLKSNTDSAKAADMTLRDLIQQNMFEDSSLLNVDTWMDIINAQDSNDTIGEYLTLLTSFDVKEAVPVLLKLFDSENPSRTKLACEYMEFVAGGETITTKDQAEAWYQNYLKEQSEQE